MKVLKSASLKKRILLIFTSITLLLVVIMAHVSYEAVRDNYLKQAEEHVKRLSRYMAARLDTQYLEFLSAKGQKRVAGIYNRFLAEQVKQSAVENAFIFNKTFRVLATAENPVTSTQLQLNQKEILLIEPGQTAVSFPFSDANGRWFVWGFYRLSDHYYLGVLEEAAQLEPLNRLSNLFMAIGLAGVILTLIAGAFIARAIVEPVEKLVNYSQKIGAGDFNVIAPAKVTGEFAILKNSMQQMQQDLATQNKEREQMLAQIAHEIRNPLGGIELLAGLVKEETKPDSISQTHLQKISEEVSGLKKQLTLFLDYSKPIKVFPRQVNIDALSAEILNNFSGRLEQKKIDFSYRTEVETVFFDAGHLKQTLINLVANSIEAVENGGRIVLSAFLKDSHIFMQVSDNGPGISKGHLAKIFTPFFTTKASGTGLGLAVCHKLCLANNAHIYADNNRDGGCTFSLKLALNQQTYAKG